MSDAPAAPVWLVFGATGWIGGQIIDLLTAAGKTVVGAKARLENREDCAR